MPESKVRELLAISNDMVSLDAKVSSKDSDNSVLGDYYEDQTYEGPEASTVNKVMADNKIDTLVLGCTHYHLIRKQIEDIYPGVRIISSSEEVVKEIGTILAERDMLAGKNDEENVFYASDLSENFINMISMLLGSEQDELNIQFTNLDM